MSVTDWIDRHALKAADHPGGVDGFVNAHPVRAFALAVVSWPITRRRRLRSRVQP